MHVHVGGEATEREQAAPDRPPDGGPAAVFFDSTVVDSCINLVQIHMKTRPPSIQRGIFSVQRNSAPFLASPEAV